MKEYDKSIKQNVEETAYDFWTFCWGFCGNMTKTKEDMAHFQAEVEEIKIDSRKMYLEEIHQYEDVFK